MPICSLAPPANDHDPAAAVAHAAAAVIEAARLLELTCRLDGSPLDMSRAIAAVANAVDVLDEAETAAAGTPGGDDLAA